MDKKNKKVVLYNISHYGYLAPVLLHSAIKNKGSVNFLLIDTGSGDETKEFFKKIKSVPFFEEYFVYNERSLHKEEQKQHLENDIVTLFDGAMNRFGINIDDVDEIYTGFDSIHAFGVYLATKKKNHYLFDLSSTTALPKGHILLSGRTTYKELLCEYDALTCDSPLVKGVIYTLGSSYEEIKNLLSVCRNSLSNNTRFAGDEKNNSFFTIKENITKLTENELSKIREFFGIQDLGGEEYDVLFLTSAYFVTNIHERNRDGTLEEVFLYPYRVLLDYLPITITNLALKVHPGRPIGTVLREKIFPKALYIRGYIPSDLFSLFNMKIRYGISSGSTSLSLVEADKKMTLTLSYLKKFEDMNKIMSVIYLSDYLGLDNIYFDEAVPADFAQSLFDIFNKAKAMNGKSDGPIVRYYSDKSCLSNTNRNKNDQDINIFCVSWDTLNNLDKDSFFILSIEKEQTDVNSIPYLADEYLLIETKNKKFLELIESYRKNILLKYSGLRIAHKIIKLADFNYDKDNAIDKNSVEYLAEKGNVISQKILALQYYKTGDKTLLKKAADLMHNVLKDGRTPTPINEAIDILVKINTEESLKEAYEIASSYSEKGHAGATVRLGRMYRDGKHVKADINEAAALMRSTGENLTPWSGELIDILVKINTEESLKEAYEIASSYSEKRHAGAMVRLGRMYRDGKGTEKNIDKATKWIREAYENDRRWISDLTEIILMGDKYKFNTAYTEYEKIDFTDIEFYDESVLGGIEKALSGKIEGTKYGKIGMRHKEVAFLNGIIRKTKPKTIVELGVSAGGSACVILNAIRDADDAKLYSFDNKTTWYREAGQNNGRKTGFLVEQTVPELMHKWELYTGGAPCKYFSKHLPKEGIDVCLIDTVHANPGEHLNILEILPFMKQNGIVIYHDTAYHCLGAGRAAKTTNCVSINTLNGKRILLKSEKTAGLPNIGAIILAKDVEDMLFALFSNLSLPWDYKITEDDFIELFAHFSKYYSRDLVQIYYYYYVFYMNGGLTDLKIAKEIAEKQTKKVFRLS